MRTPRDAQLGYEWGIAYSIEKTFPRTPESAKVVVEELRRIQGNSPVLAPSAVVEASRPADAPLHGAFCWNDEVAAERWRHRQAQDLQRAIRAVHIWHDADDREYRSVPVPVFASFTPPDERRGYRDVMISLGVPQHRSALLLEAQRDLMKFRNRYAVLTELADVVAAIDRFIEGDD